jgi:hypothetical protein
MGGFRLVFGPFNHQEGLDEVIAYYAVNINKLAARIRMPFIVDLL